MPLFLILASLLGYFFVAKKYADMPFSVAPIFTVPIITLALYGFALVGLLSQAATGLFYLGLVLFLLSMATIFSKQNSQIKATLVSPAFIFFMLLLLIAAIYLRHAYIHYFDEYSFWGLVSKYIAYYQQLPNRSAPIVPVLLNYPVAGALFHDYFFNAAKHYSVYIGYFANNFFLLTPLMIFFFNKKYKAATVSLLCLIIILAFFHKSFFNNFMIDILVSAYFAGIVLTYCFYPKAVMRLIVVMPAILLLPLVKQVGLLFNVFILLFFLLNSCIDLFQKKINKKTYLIELSILLILLPLGLALVKYSWVSHYKSIGAQAFSHAINFSSIKQALSIGYSQTYTIAQKLFLKDLFFSGVDRLHLPALVWYLILAIAWFDILKKAPQTELAKYKSLLFILIVTWFCYSLGVYLLEAITFKSGVYGVNRDIGRYIGIYLFSVVLLTLGIQLNLRQANFAKYPTKWLAGLLVALIVGFLASSPKGPRTLDGKISKQTSEQIRQLTQAKQQPQTICLLNGETGNSLIPYIFRFEVIPNRLIETNINKITKQNLAKCQYILLYQVTKNFIALNQKNFMRDKTAFLRITDSDRETVLLNNTVG